MSGHPTSKKPTVSTTKVIFVGVLLVVAAGMLAAFRVSSPAAPLPRGAVTLSFTGYTNDAMGERFARFTVTNGARVPIRRWVACRIDRQHQYGNPYKASIVGPA